MVPGSVSGSGFGYHFVFHPHYAGLYRGIGDPSIELPFLLGGGGGRWHVCNQALL